MISGGKSLVSTSPAFSNDGKNLLVCNGTSVSIFSTSTSLLITSLDGHDAPVTSVVVVPLRSKIICYCWTASLDGTLRYWDFSLPYLMRIIQVRLPIFSMVIPALLKQSYDSQDMEFDVFAYVSVQTIMDNSHGQIRKCNLTKSHLVNGLILTKTQKPEIITVSPSGKFIGVQSKRKIRIWSLPDIDSDYAKIKKIALHHTKSLTTLAFHPTERIVAAGDETGRILIWRGFGDRTFFESEKEANGKLMNREGDRPGVREDDDADSCTTWHWHSAVVLVLYFPLDGAYLYSAGQEGVLVVWNLDTGKKKFLPRIGSSLLYFKISPDPLLSAISCADNQIHLLKMPSLEIVKSISGIKFHCSLPEKYKGFREIAFDQTSGLVALHTENYRIQLYSLFDDHEVSQVQICERNYVPGDDIMVAVTLVAFSPDGSILSTVEAKLPEEEIGGTVSLKFWALGSQKKDFRLSTIIYEPHRDALVSSVSFHPKLPLAVSSSYGGDFKIWVRNQKIHMKDQIVENSGWTCHSVGSYKKKPMTAAAFSTDGSVLAVAAETVVTLWDPFKNVLVSVIGETPTPIVSLSFVEEYLVSASKGSKPQLTVWTLSKLSMHWAYDLHVEAVACALDGSSFAVLSLIPDLSNCLKSNEASFLGRDGLILLFNVNDANPVATWSVRKACGGGLCFLKGNTVSLEDDSSSEKTITGLLVFINGDHEYVIFDPYGKGVDKPTTVRQKTDVLETEQYGYASIYGELQVFEQRKNQDLSFPTVPSERPWETVFSGSSHNLPPLTKLCTAFLESILKKQTTTAE